jgi:predicted porin
VLAAYAQTDKEQTAAADQKRQTLTLGYDHDLSKRTDLYAAVVSDKVTALTRGTGFAVGIRHRF